MAQAIARKAQQETTPREIDHRIEEKWLVVIECDDEAHQREVLRWAKDAGTKAKAVIS